MGMAEQSSTSASDPSALLGGMASEPQSDERRATRRFPYQHVQRIAFLEGNRLPSDDNFRPVRCHEISQDGISFFYPSAPEGQQLIIALGSQGLETLVLASVRYHVPAQAVTLFDPSHTVDERFLVECAFVRRVGT